MIEVECHLWGEKFYPSEVEGLENLNLRLVDEPGTLGNIGRYKGKPVPCGSCCIYTPELIPIGERILWMADLLKRNKEKFREARVTDISFWIYWYSGNQGNMEFTTEEVKAIADTGVPLCIDYIFDDNESDLKRN